MNKKQNQILFRMQFGSKRKKGKNVYSIRNYYNDLWYLINSCDPDDYRGIIERIKKYNSRTFLWSKEHLFPRELSKLYMRITFSLHDKGERLLKWYATYIDSYSTELNGFLHYKDSFEKNFILGNYEEAIKILDEVERTFGYSLWLLESRFSVLEYYKGLEGNKEYLESISSSEAAGWVKAFAFLFSFKAEKNINNRQYVHRIEKYLDEFGSDYRPFIREKMFSINNYELQDINNILSCVFCYSLIDIYCTFVDTTIRVLSDNSSQEMDVKIVKDSLSMINHINDVVIEKLKFKAGIEKRINISELDVNFLSICDLYTEGKYAEAIIKSKRDLDLMPNCFELYEIFIKSHVMSDTLYNIDEKDETIQSDIYRALYTSYVKDENTPMAYYLLSRLLRLFTNSYLGIALSNFFVDKYAVGLDPVLMNGKELVSIVKNIKLISIVPEMRQNLKECFKVVSESSSTVALLNYYYNGEGIYKTYNIDPNRLKWYSIKRRINNNDKVCEELFQWYNELKTEESIYESYQKERISTELYYLLIKDSKYIDAEEILVDETIRNHYGTLRMNIDKLFNEIGVKTVEFKRSICTPIAAYLYYKGDSTQIYTNVANFLSTNSFNKPSDLFGHESTYGKERLHYFLKKVCIRDVLDSMFDVFESEIEVDNERIDICRYLQTEDSINASDYIDEISQIMQRRKVLKGVKYLEDVKIELDFENIYRSQQELFEDDYKRFMQIGLLSKEYTAYDISNNRLLLVYGDDTEQYSHAKIAFSELLKDYRQEFAFGKFGLDPVIGTRIRHGHLQNNIRITFEKNNIAFFSISAEDRTYFPSADFEILCMGLKEDVRNQVIGYISDFSKKVDEYIEKINREYLQIKIEGKNAKGLLDFDISNSNVILLMREAQHRNNINLVRELLEIFWRNRLELCLNNIKAFFDYDAKNYFIDALAELRDNINTIPDDLSIKAILIDSISRARTDLQNAISRICGWFKLPKEQDYDNYSLNELVDICEEINKQVVPNYNDFEIEKTINAQSLLLGKTFTNMVDILIILFTNAFYHSGYINNLQKLRISLSIEEDSENIILEMVNNLNEEQIDINSLYEIIDSLKEKLNESIGKREYNSYEGKSGYLKICKILQHTLSAFSFFEFGLCEDDTKYFVKISMQKDYLIVKGEGI